MGDVVFDPFSGIGTTCVVSKEMGRKYVGCDISDKYCNISKNTLKNVGKQTELEEW